MTFLRSWKIAIVFNVGDKKLCLLLLTYNRLDYAKRTLRAALDNIRWSGELHVHIADDGSPNGYVSDLCNIVAGYRCVHSVGSSCSNRRGYGANHGLATQFIHPWADIVLTLEDDWELTKILNLDTIVPILQDGRVGCLRLGYLGFTQPLWGEVLRIAGQVVLLFDPLSAEPHLFAGHPRLTLPAWERDNGPWPEGLTPQQTEFEVAHRDRTGIAWPMFVHPDGDLFVHIGSVRA